MMPSNNSNISNTLLKVLLIEVGTLVIFVSLVAISNSVKKKNNNREDY